MNTDFLLSLGELSPPQDDHNGPFNSIASNMYGDVILLNGVGELFFGNIHSNIESKLSPLEIEDGGHVHDMNTTKRSREDLRLLLRGFTNIEFDSAGKLLLLWGKEDVAIILIPDSMSRDGFIQVDSEKNASEHCVLLSVYNIHEDVSNSTEDIDQNAANIIVKARIHPFNSNAIVILRESKWLRVVNISQYESHSISLGDKIKFTSCSFGPHMLDFSSLTLFLLSVTGDIYYVCPIIPKGSAVSTALVSELWSTVTQLKNYRDRVVSSYAGAMEAYLCAMLPRSGWHGDSSNGFGGEFVICGKDVIDKPSQAVQRGQGSRSLSISAPNHYIPLLQGPIARAGSTRKGGAGLRAVDLCVPSSSGYGRVVDRLVAEKEGAPVLLVAYSDGSVETLLLDNDELQLSLTLPAWKSLNRLKADVALPSQFAPRLLQVEVNQVSPKSTGSNNWKLTPDPVVSHYIHVTSFESCRSYLLVNRWLEAALKLAGEQRDDEEGSSEEPLQEVNFAVQEAKDSRFANSSESVVLNRRGGHPGDDDDDDDDFLNRRFNSRQPLYDRDGAAAGQSAEGVNFNFSDHESQCIPIVDLYDESAAMAGSARKTVVCGLSILRDPFAGHTALFRTSSLKETGSAGMRVGEMWAVNLTVHATLCELHQNIANQKARGERARKPLQDALRSVSSQQSVRWRHAQQLISTIGEGLRKMPQVIHQAHMEQQQQLQQPAGEDADKNKAEVDAINSRVLDQAALQVQRDVILPMKELLNATKFHFELVQETRAAQLEALLGARSGSGAPAEPQSSQPLLSLGIKRLLTSLEEEQQLLVRRISAMKEKYEHQREAAEKFLTFAISQTTKLSRGEVLYRRQLEEWSAKVVRMGDQVESALRLLPRRTVLASPAPATPAGLPSADSSTPQAQPQSLPLPSLQLAPPSGTGTTLKRQLSSPIPGAASPGPIGGPSPILHSASPLMASWRSPNVSYEISGRRGAGRSSIGNATGGNSLTFSARFDSSTGSIGGSAASGTSTASLLNEEEQAACQELLTAQLNMIAHSKATVLALEERVKAITQTLRTRQQSLSPQK